MLSIDNLPDRKHIPQLLKQLGLNGYGVELGVAAAEYSEFVLENSDLKTFYGVDMWADRKHTEKEYKKVLAKAEKWGDRFVVIRKKFDEAVSLFEDNYFDFIFVDGYARKANRHGATMREWWPKLKSGGIMAIHDYAPMFPGNVEAINKWAEEAGVKGFTTKKESKPAWLTLKP